MGKLLDEAIVFAMKAHAGHVRKAEGSAYVLHPMEAAVIAGTLSRDEKVITAALLHDAIAYAGIPADELRMKFGCRVAELVSSMSENKMRDLPPEETWELRKKEALKSLFDTEDEDVKILWLSDELSNLRSIHTEVLNEGDDFFLRFNQKDKKKHEWYFKEVLRGLSSLKGTDPYEEFERLIEETFGDK